MTHEDLKTKLGWVLHDWDKKPFTIDKNGRKKFNGWNSTRLTYSEVMAYYPKYGLGLQPLGNLACIDIDNCILEDGSLTDLAKRVLLVTGYSYTEISPSGKGLHVWIYHDGTLTTRVRPGLELYAGSKYCTITGEIYQGGPIKKVEAKVFEEFFTVEDIQRTRTADPIKKPGMVGAFCRVYDIHEALAMLPNIYERVDETRYKYIPAKSAPGVITYEDKWVISNHATDPACGGQHNAFDIVKIHLFGRAKKYDSDMYEYINTDERVRDELLKEFDSSEPWVAKLKINKMGHIKLCLPNLALILDNNFDIRYNELEDLVEMVNTPWKKRGSALENADFIELKFWLEEKYGFTNCGKMIEDCCLHIANKNRYNPVIEMLESLPEWDGQKRAETLLIDAFGAENSDYTRAVTRKFLAAAVKRAYEPGCKFDCILALIGAQGLRKSTFLRDLSMGFFTDDIDLFDTRSKTGAEKILGRWIVEFGEMVGMRKTDANAVKAFMSRQEDRYRPAYGRVTEQFKRRCVFAATGNQEDGFLQDLTGNRRWWVVKCEHKFIIDIDYKQVWAEVLACYQNEPLYLQGEEEKAAEVIQQAHIETDDRIGLVRDFIEGLIPENWYDLELNDKRFYNGPEGTYKRSFVSAIEVWSELFKKQPCDVTFKDKVAITKMFKYLGLKPAGEKAIKGYGRVKVWSIPKCVH